MNNTFNKQQHTSRPFNQLPLSSSILPSSIAVTLLPTTNVAFAAAAPDQLPTPNVAIAAAAPDEGAPVNLTDQNAPTFRYMQQLSCPHSPLRNPSPDSSLNVKNGFGC
jgi:hypothetical protein